MEATGRGEAGERKGRKSYTHETVKWKIKTKIGVNNKLETFYITKKKEMETDY